MLKYVHARMPGSDLVHVVPAQALRLDERYDSDESRLFADAPVNALCGRASASWTLDKRGQRCERCGKFR